MKRLKARAVIRADKDAWHVDVHWSCEGFTLDRPCTHSYLVGNVPLARRLMRAVNAQAVYRDPQIVTDAAGLTFVSAASRVMGRYLNSDLRRLGF